MRTRYPNKRTIVPSGSVNVLFRAEQHYRLLQFAFTIAAIPTTSEDITITRISDQGGTDYNIVFVKENPHECNFSQLLVTDHFECYPDDILQVQFTNTENQQCTIELVLEQV